MLLFQLRAYKGSAQGCPITRLPRDAVWGRLAQPRPPTYAEDAEDGDDAGGAAHRHNRRQQVWDGG